MTAEEQVQSFLRQLGNPYWTPHPTSRYLHNWQDNIAAFNLYYVMIGKPTTFAKGDMQKNFKFWQAATSVVKTTTANGPIGDSVLILKPQDFWHHIVATQPSKFARHASMGEWYRVFHEQQLDYTPIKLAEVKTK